MGIAKLTDSGQHMAMYSLQLRYPINQATLTSFGPNSVASDVCNVRLEFMQEVLVPQLKEYFVRTGFYVYC